MNKTKVASAIGGYFCFVAIVGLKGIKGLMRLSSKKVWFDKIFAVVMKKRSIDNAVLP